MNKNRIKLNICGIECAITSEEDESYVRSIGSEIEKAITEITEHNPRVSITMASLLVSLSFCDEARKSAASADNLRSQIKDYLEDSSRARLEAEEARREIERMKKVIQTLRARLGTDVPDDRAKEAESSKPVAAPQGQKIPPETAKPASYGHRPPEEMMTEETNFMSFFEKKDEE